MDLLVFHFLTTIRGRSRTGLLSHTFNTPPPLAIPVHRISTPGPLIRRFRFPRHLHGAAWFGIVVVVLVVAVVTIKIVVVAMVVIVVVVVVVVFSVLVVVVVVVVVVASPVSKKRKVVFVVVVVLVVLGVFVLAVLALAHAAPSMSRKHSDETSVPQPKGFPTRGPRSLEYVFKGWG